MNNPHLSETKQTEQQREKHDSQDAKQTDGFGDAALHPLLQLQQTIGNRAVGQLIQRKEPGGQENKTGLPDNLKAGLESMSGLSMADVKVHYNSPKPADIQALAYTKGTDIHVAPGQEKHLPHEAWHAVQQKQGRVASTMQLKGEQVNEDSTLEREADEMGLKALQLRPEAMDMQHTSDSMPSKSNDVIQAKWDKVGRKLYKWDRRLRDHYWYYNSETTEFHYKSRSGGTSKKRLEQKWRKYSYDDIMNKIAEEAHEIRRTAWSRQRAQRNMLDNQPLLPPLQPGGGERRRANTNPPRTVRMANATAGKTSQGAARG